jgi:LEA14-like dessication related protein
MKNNKYHAVGTVPKSNRKFVETVKIYNPNTRNMNTSFIGYKMNFKKQHNYICEDVAFYSHVENACMTASLL